MVYFLDFRWIWVITTVDDWSLLRFSYVYLMDLRWIFPTALLMWDFPNKNHWGIYGEFVREFIVLGVPYPLVNIQKTMENHHAINGKIHYFYGHFP